jgi:hypothetical protein
MLCWSGGCGKRDTILTPHRAGALYTQSQAALQTPQPVCHANALSFPLGYSTVRLYRSTGYPLFQAGFRLPLLPSRHFALKLRGHKVKAGKTSTLPTPRVDPQELREIEQEYLRRYFRSIQEIEPVTAAVRPTIATSTEKEIQQSLAFYQPISRRERLC